MKFSVLALLIFSLGASAQNKCPDNVKRSALDSGPAWNGWGADDANGRFASGIAASHVPDLKLKWAFGFPGVKSAWGQPAVAGGRVFLGVDTGDVYSLDATNGCVIWTFKADNGVRTAITIAKGGAGKFEALFGDVKANAYAVDAETGTPLWKVKVEDHASAKITGAPKVFDRRLYVPVASGEEGAGGNPKYPCCTFRGSVVALDIDTGKQVWKTYMIPEEPKPTTKDANGVQHFGAAGAGVWGSPTIDAKRHVLYATTGDAYTEPAAKTTDAIVALDTNSGKMLWSVQGTENDVWLAGCKANEPKGNCPQTLGPDSDFSASPMLKTLSDGKQVLIAGQKSGNVWAYDPDNKGAVVWRTALVANPNEFGGKIIWGGASDNTAAYFGLGPGGIASVALKDGERKWFTPLTPAPEMAKHTGQDGPLTAIPGVVFSGGWDGVLRALSTTDGHVVWEYNTVHDYDTVNGVPAKGGSMGAAGPVIVGGKLFTTSGYVGVKNGITGNVLLAFE
jgi:polyvinyl alcohol dehydrogenase (cytochrome)